MNRRRERRWQSSQDRARVAAELIEEAESLTETAGIATPVDVARDKLPPPLRVEATAPVEAPRAKLDQDTPPSPPESAATPPLPSAEPAPPAPPPAPVADDPLYISAREASERGDLDRAAASYRDLLAREPGHVKARNNLALILDARGDRDGALAELDRALEADPHSRRIPTTPVCS